MMDATRSRDGGGDTSERTLLLPRRRDRDGRALVGLRSHLHAFLEAKTRAGLVFELFIILIIVLAVVTFVLRYVRWVTYRQE